MSKLILVPFVFLFIAGCGSPSAEEIKKTVDLTNPAGHEVKDGIAAVIVMDISGSMANSVKNAAGEDEAKLSIAKRSLVSLVKQFEDYAAAHKDQNIQVGVVVFGSESEELIPLGSPNSKQAADKVAGLGVRGGTQIGDAMLFAKKKADVVKLSKVHILTITDGENGGGADPAVVTEQFNKLSVPPSTYLIGFDIGSSAFAAVKDKGGMVLSATSETDLLSTLKFVLEKKILLEKE